MHIHGATTAEELLQNQPRALHISQQPTDEVVEAMGAYLASNPDTFVRLWGWRLSSDSPFLQAIGSHVVHLGVEILSLKSLDFLVTIPKLRSLALDCQTLGKLDPGPLAHLKSLDSLTLSHWNGTLDFTRALSLSDLQLLACKCDLSRMNPNLKGLRLGSCRITAWGDIDSWNSLSILALDSVKQTDNSVLNQIASLPQLASLQLIGTKGRITDMKPLSRLAELINLHIESASAEISGLSF